MKYKSLFIAALILGLGSLSSAQDLACADSAVAAATLKNFNLYKASTGSCGAKLLSAGEYTETYLVCVSDESDPSEWVVVVKKAETDKTGKVAKNCVVQYADVQFDSETPHFDSSEGLLKTKECSIDDGSPKTLVCQ